MRCVTNDIAISSVVDARFLGLKNGAAFWVFHNECNRTHALLYIQITSSVMRSRCVNSCACMYILTHAIYRRHCRCSHAQRAQACLRTPSHSCLHVNMCTSCILNAHVHTEHYRTVHSRTIPGPFQDHSRTITGPFQGHSRTIPGPE